MTNSAQHLEQHFDVAFSAPNGIKKLRELILTLAMQGKLVPQDPNDTPASELLKDIASEKARLVSEGKIKKQKPLPAIPDDEKPYDLPQGWKWVRLGDCGYLQTGTTPATKDPRNYGNFIPFIGPGDIQNGTINYYANGLSQEGLSSARLIENGSILMVCIGGSIGKFAVSDRDVTCNQQINTITAFKPIPIEYLGVTMASSYFQSQVLINASGSATPIINKQKWSEIIVPLPPLAEQHRIVAKIDQLMARCDALEALQQAKEAQRLSVHQAAIRQLLDAEHTHTAWQFLQTHFAELYSVKANVSELRKAILQLAVMGILLPKTSDWSTKKLKMLTTKIGSGSTPSGGKEAYQMSGIPLIRSMNVHFEGFSYKGLAYIDESQAEKLKNVIVQENDVLLNITGASIGRVTVAPREMMGARVNQHVCIIRLNEQVEPKFLVSFLSSPLIQNMINDVQVGATREALTKGMIEQFDIPLPSLSEQHRIVAKIDQLMSLCDNLEQQIDASQAKQSKLLAAVMSGV